MSADALRRLLADLPLPDDDSAGAVLRRAGAVLRPPGALRRLDQVAIHLAAWQRTSTPDVGRPAVLVFAGDHGVVAGGVSAFPASITAEMLAAVEQSRATVSAMAARVGAAVMAVDCGVGRPTGDIRVEPALDAASSDAIIDLAVEAVDEAASVGADVLVLGELGIGNTTVAAAVVAHLLGGDPADWVGRGTGVDDEGLARKQQAVTTALARCAEVTDPLAALLELGGGELVAMAAACARARHLRLPVLLDGFVVAAAVLPLWCVAPTALDHCLAGHVSAEAGHRRLLERLQLEPILDLGLRLGEASGALAALPLLGLACAAVNDVATFDEWFER